MNKPKNPLIPYIAIVTAVCFAFQLLVFVLLHDNQKAKRIASYENYINNVATSVFSDFAKNHRNTLDNSHIRIPFKNYTLYQWNAANWEKIFSTGNEILDRRDLTKNYPPALFTERFEKIADIWSLSSNPKTALDINHPTVIFGFDDENEKLLLVVELSATLTRIVADDPFNTRNYLPPILVISIVIALIIVSFFRNNLRTQVMEITKFIDNPDYTIQKPWLAFENVYTDIESLHKRLQEARFEFEREAAVMTAKADYRLRSLSLLREVASLGNTTTSFSGMMHQILDKLNRFFHTQSAIAYIFKTDGTFELVATDSVPQDFQIEMKNYLATDSLGIAKRKVDKIGFVTLEETSFLFENSSIIDHARRVGIVGYMRISLMQKTEYIGAIHLYSMRVVPNDEPLEKLLRTLGEEIAVSIDNRFLYINLQEKVAESNALYEISKSLISTIDYSLLLDQILWMIQDRYRYAACAILLLDADRKHLFVRSSWGFQSDVSQHKIPMTKGITGWVASSGQPLIVPDVAKDPRYIATDFGIQSELAVPLVVGGKTIGVLNIESKELNRFSEHDLWFLSSLAAQASLAIDRAEVYDKLREQALRDPLTKLYNRYYCDNFLANEARDFLMRGIPMSLIFIDINGLKKVNDTYGHNSGDMVLLEVAEFIRTHFPKNDVLRYGGDEIVILLPEISEKQLQELIANLRKKKIIWQLKMAEKHPFQLDFAIGGATANRPDEVELLVHYADILMYKDKFKDDK